MAEVKITISGQDNASPTFKTVEASGKSAFNGIKSEAQNAAAGSTSALDSILTHWKEVVAGFAIYKLAGIFTDLIKESALAAARFETLGVVMRVVGNNSGYTGDQMEVFAKGLQNAGISMTESRQSLTRMVQAQLDLTESSKLARVAQDAAVIGNINSSEAFQRLVYGIQSAQVEMLRTIGINVNFEDSYAKVANRAGRVVESFNEAEKANIRMNTAFEAGEKIAGTYTAAMETAGKQIMSLPRHFENLKVLIGGLFTPALSEIIEIITKSVVDLNGELGGEGLDKIKEWGTNFRIAIISVEAEFMRLGMLLDKIGGTITSAKMLLFGPGAALGIENSVKGFEAAAKANMEYEASYEATSKELEGLALKQIKLEESLTAAGKEAAREAELAAEKKRMAANPGAMAAEAESGATKKLADEWAKTRRDLEVNISKVGLNEFEQKIVEIQSKAQELGIKYKDVAVAQVDIERWASSQVAQAVMEAENKRLEMARDSAVKRLEFEKETVSGQISALETWKTELEKTYDFAINKAKEYAAAEADITADLAKRSQFIAGGFGGTTKESISSQTWSASKAVNELINSAQYSRDATKIKSALDAIEGYLTKFKGVKDEMGLSVLGSIEYHNEYKELTDQLKNLGDAAGEQKNQWQSFAEAQKTAIEGAKSQLDALKTKVTDLQAEIDKTKEIKIDTTAATASIDALQAKIAGLGSEAISLGGAGAGGNISGTMANVSQALLDAVQKSQAQPGTQNQAIYALGNLATSLGNVSKSATEASHDLDYYAKEYNDIFKEYERMSAQGMDVTEQYFRAIDAYESTLATASSAISKYEPPSYPPGGWSGGSENIITWDSYQHGTDYVPRTGPYKLDKGEAVIPAEENKGRSVREGNVTFSPTFNVHGINDPMGFSRIADNYMRQSINQLAGRIRTAGRN